jgi:hypothetical protein
LFASRHAQKIQKAIEPPAQTENCTRPVFAKPPKADMCSANGDVRFGPEADMGIARAPNRNFRTTSMSSR